MKIDASIGFEVAIQRPHEEALNLVIDALKVEGFGVLTRIDVHKTLKEKLNQDFRPYVILGACNPPLAHRALSSDAAVGLMLPCNVTVEAASPTSALVRIANPQAMLQTGAFQNNPALLEVANEAQQRLERVAEALRKANN